jgi:prevent-host-death family protein
VQARIHVALGADAASDHVRPFVGVIIVVELAMRQISIQDLKANLSGAISEAESGNTIIITRHNEPVAKLIPAHPQFVHGHTNLAKEGIKPALKRGKKIPYLDVLLKDRGDR